MIGDRGWVTTHATVSRKLLPGSSLKLKTYQSRTNTTRIRSIRIEHVRVYTFQSLITVYLSDWRPADISR